MNAVDAKVIEVLSEPKHKSWDNGEVSCWLVKVEYADIGGHKEKDLIFDTKEQAKKVEEGYIFQD